MKNVRTAFLAFTRETASAIRSQCIAMGRCCRTGVASNRLFLPRVALSLCASYLQGAVWQGGGSGDWTSAGVDNWGLGSGAYPGNGTNDTGTHTIADATAFINEGESVTLTNAVYLNRAEIKVTGGNLISTSPFLLYDSTGSTNGGRITLSGGVLTGKPDLRLQNTTSVLVDGGMLGTRVSGIVKGPKPPDDMLVTFYGNATLRLTEAGKIDIHTLDWSKANAGTIGTVIFEGVVSGNYMERCVLYIKAYDDNAAAAIMRFVFSPEGLTPLRQFSGNGFWLGSPSRLAIDVSAFKDTKGTTPHPIIDYATNIQNDGYFSTVSVVDDLHGELRPGTKGSLEPGEYYLDYADNALEENGTMITLYYRNPPWEKGTVISIR